MTDSSGIAWRGDEPGFYKELVSILLEVVRIPSPSGAETQMTNHCSTFLYHSGFSVEQDEFGNIMATRGTAPSGKYVLLNAHMDTVLGGSIENCFKRTKRAVEESPENASRRIRMDELQKQYDEGKPEYDRLIEISKDRKTDKTTRNKVNKRLDELYHKSVKIAWEINSLKHIVKSKPDPLKAYDYSLEPTPECWIPEDIVYHPKTRTVLASNESGMYVGGDDKAGVAIILMLAAQTVHPCKVLLTTHEEMPFGTRGGSMEIPPSFYDDVSVSFTLDRRGGGDLIDEIDEKRICSVKLTDLIREHGGGCMALYHATGGMMADAANIARYVPAVNMSVGYYLPHEIGDYIFVPETFRAACVVENSLDDLTNNYTDYEQFRYVPPAKKKRVSVFDHGSEMA